MLSCFQFFSKLKVDIFLTNEIHLRILKVSLTVSVSQGWWWWGGGPCSVVPFHFCPMFACARSFSLFVPYNISAYHIPPTLSSPTPSKNIHEAENIKSRVLRVTLNSFLNLQVNHHNTQTHQNASSSLLVLIFSMWYLILLEIPL